MAKESWNWLVSNQGDDPSTSPFGWSSLGTWGGKQNMWRGCVCFFKWIVAVKKRIQVPRCVPFFSVRGVILWIIYVIWYYFQLLSRYKSLFKIQWEQSTQKRWFFCNNTRLFLWDSFNWLRHPHPLWCWFSSGAARKHELSRTLGAAQDANGYLAMLTNLFQIPTYWQGKRLKRTKNIINTIGEFMDWKDESRESPKTQVIVRLGFCTEHVDNAGGLYWDGSMWTHPKLRIERNSTDNFSSKLPLCTLPRHTYFLWSNEFNISGITWRLCLLRGGLSWNVQETLKSSLTQK